MSAKDHKHAEELLDYAREYREKAFAPYSEYRVGAALLTEKGIYRGANVEVSGRSTSVHAEMMAAFNAVLDGVQEFRLLAIAPDGETGVAPCGLCQHTLAQFTDDLPILEDNGEGEKPTEYSLDDLIGPAYSPSTQHPETVTR
jgi:cytidine deaminase